MILSNFQKEKIEHKKRSELIEEIRNEITAIRHKIHDIKKVRGPEDWYNHIEGGLTCMLVTLAHLRKELEEVEQKQNN